MKGILQLSLVVLCLVVPAVGGAANGRHASAPFGGFGELELEVRDEESAPSRNDGATTRPFLATLNAGSLKASVGPQRLAYDSLIHKDLDRRGALAAWDVSDRTRLRGFGMQAREGTGYQRLAGNDRADYQLNGWLLEQGLPLGDENSLDIAFGWLSGQARVDNAAARRGDAWSVGGRFATLSQRLSLEAEYAGSQFDWHSAGSADSSPGDADNAYKLDLKLTAPDDAALAWHLGTEVREVARWFGSLANPGLGADRRQLRLYGGLRDDVWQLDLGVEHRQDNLDTDPTRPVKTGDRFRLASVWTPDSPFLFDPGADPAYRLTAEIGNDRQWLADGLAMTGPPRQRLASLALASEFSHPGWLWGMRAKGGLAPGAIDAAQGEGVYSLTLDLYGDYRRGLAAPIKPALSWQQRRDAVTGTGAQRWRAGLAAAAIDLGPRLQSRINMTIEHHERTGAAADDLAADFGADFVWTLQRPTSHRGGLAFVVSGNVLTGKDGGSDTQDDYGLMLSLSSNHPLGRW